MRPSSGIDDAVTTAAAPASILPKTGCELSVYRIHQRIAVAHRRAFRGRIRRTHRLQCCVGGGGGGKAYPSRWELQPVGR